MSSYGDGQTEKLMAPAKESTITQSSLGEKEQLLISGRAVNVSLIVAALVAGLLIWFLRRPDQLLHPYIWDEEFKVLNNYQLHGFLYSAASRYQGYFLWPTSFSVSIAAAISFLHLPALEYLFCTLWYLATLALILIPNSRVRLSWRVGLALLLALAPMNPEVFGVLLYSFWWTTLWPLVSLLWSEDYWVLRVVVLIVGGMSSLAGAAIFVAYGCSYLITRRRRDLLGTVLLFLMFVAQLAALLSSTRANPVHPRSAAIQSLRNYSLYSIGWLQGVDPVFLGFAGACILGALIFVVAQSLLGKRDPFRRELVVLLVGLIIFSGFSSASVPLTTNPLTAGPRYYFLPFVAIGWLLALLVLASRNAWTRFAATALIALSLLLLAQGFSRHDDLVNWTEQLARCRNTTRTFTVPVQQTGSRLTLWKGALLITPDTCRRLGY